MNAIINSRFQEILWKRHKKISQVARDTGISRAALTNLFYGRNAGITFEVLAKLCVYLDCEIGDLLEVQEVW